MACYTTMDHRSNLELGCGAHLTATTTGGGGRVRRGLGRELAVALFKRGSGRTALDTTSVRSVRIGRA
jgi:hypothetical protein